MSKNVCFRDKAFWMKSKAFFLQKRSRYRDRRDFIKFVNGFIKNVNGFFPFGSKFLDIVLLNIVFLMIKIKNLKIHYRCIQSFCLPRELMDIQHRSLLAWNREPDDKCQDIVVSLYQRYTSLP